MSAGKIPLRLGKQVSKSRVFVAVRLGVSTRADFKSGRNSPKLTRIQNPKLFGTARRKSITSSKPGPLSTCLSQDTLRGLLGERSRHWDSEE